MTKHNLKPKSESIGWLLECSEIWDSEKIKEYGRICGITEISIKHQNKEVTTIRV